MPRRQKRSAFYHPRRSPFEPIALLGSLRTLIQTLACSEGNPPMISNRNNSRSGRFPDLICLSHLRWDFVFQRPQHLMSRFARECRVFFLRDPLRLHGRSGQLPGRSSGPAVRTPHLSHPIAGCVRLPLSIHRVAALPAPGARQRRWPAVADSDQPHHHQQALRTEPDLVPGRRVSSIAGRETGIDSNLGRRDCEQGEEGTLREVLPQPSPRCTKGLLTEPGAA